MGRPADETRVLKAVYFEISNCWGTGNYKVVWRHEHGKVVFWLIHEEKLGEDGEPLWYRIERVNGTVWCSCPDEGGKKSPGGCKHAASLRYFFEQLEVLFRT